MNTWLLAAVIAGLVAGGAYRLRALTPSGALAAWCVGTIVFRCTSLWGTAVLLTFFITSSLFSRLWRGRKQVLIAEYAKGNARDWAQVLANGGLATALALLACVGLGHGPYLALGLMGALAAATADTWATELGGLSSHPRWILSGTPVSPGTSGGVSWLGILASLVGGALIGIVAALPLPAGVLGVRWNTLPTASVIFSGAVAGLGASLVDSLLGATVQAIYWCPVCQKETERRVHRCGTRTRPYRGYRWVTNDVVNFVATLVGAIIAIFAALLAMRPM